MAKMNHIIFCVLVLSVILYGSAHDLSGNEEENYQDNFDDGEDEINRRGQRKAVTDFEKKTWNVAANLYKGANKPEVENVIFSPLSLTTAMVMLNSGAGGETAREIQNHFKFGTNSEITIRNQTEILNSLTNQASGKETAVKLLTASRIYANSQKPQLRENYVRAVSSLGEVETLDFSDPQPAVAEINDWVNNQTQGEISKIVAEDNFSGDTAAVLLNFLYFKAPWKQEFDKKDTREADFHVSESKKVQVDMMSISAEFPYADLEEAQASAVFLPYKGDRFSMVIYLPWPTSNLSAVEEKLETLVPSEVRNKAETSEISLHLPKFKITSSLDFKEILESLGVQKLFKREEADFSGMSESPQFHVSKIKQKVVIEVNEEGTEAVAVTADVTGLLPISGPVVIKVDRPFIFQIYDSVTGAILFGGRISNPNPNPNLRQDEANNNNQVRTTTTTAAPEVSTTVSPQAAFEDRIVDRIMAKLTAALEERDRILNFNMTRMQSQITRMEEAATASMSKDKVQAILKAYKNDRNDLVKSLLNDLTNDQQLDKSMPEIIRGMFDGNITNYPKIISLLQSAKRGQYKSGLTSLIDLFHNVNNNVGNSSSASSPSLLDEPKYLELAYFARNDFGTEFQPKFPKMVQNLVWKQKTCIRNLYSNLYLFVDRDEGLRDGGYSVSSRRKPASNSTGFCDWKIVTLGEGASFIIRQRESNPKGPFYNLHVLKSAVLAGTNVHRPHHFWKIQLRKNAQEVTFQSTPATSDAPSYFLCSSPKGISSRRPVEVLQEDGKSCSWFIDSE